MDTTPPPVGRDAASTDTAARRDLSGLVNGEIRKIAETDVLSLGVAGEAYSFMCECGCMKMVDLSLAVYDADGAWLDGHKPA
jgi:hypothetical protein